MALTGTLTATNEQLTCIIWSVVNRINRHMSAADQLHALVQRRYYPLNLGTSVKQYSATLIKLVGVWVVGSPTGSCRQQELVSLAQTQPVYPSRNLR